MVILRMIDSQDYTGSEICQIGVGRDGPLANQNLVVWRCAGCKAANSGELNPISAGVEALLWFSVERVKLAISCISRTKGQTGEPPSPPVYKLMPADDRFKNGVRDNNSHRWN